MASLPSPPSQMGLVPFLIIRVPGRWSRTLPFCPTCCRPWSKVHTPPSEIPVPWAITARPPCPPRRRGRPPRPHHAGALGDHVLLPRQPVANLHAPAVVQTQHHLDAL